MPQFPAQGSTFPLPSNLPAMAMASYIHIVLWFHWTFTTILYGDPGRLSPFRVIWGSLKAREATPPGPWPQDVSAGLIY